MENREATTPARVQPHDDFGSNAIRLNLGEWIIVTIIVAIVFSATPSIWRRFETFEPATTYRIPFSLSEDYWHFERWVEATRDGERALVLGDSVVWGEYVRPGESIAGQLNGLAGAERFANLGISGMHPVALLGLVRHHGAELRGRAVILHLNLLWMSSPVRDLESSEESRILHARLLPQLAGRIPGYRAEASERIGIALERRLDVWNWVRHVRIAYFDSQDLHHWTVDRSGESAWDQLTMELPQPSDTLRHEPIDWQARGIRVQSFDWVELSGSRQWAAFRECIELLRSGGCELTVLVGPLNEHLMDASSKARHAELRAAALRWLDAEGVRAVVPDVLPSNEYADASHPLAPGYARLAESIGWEE